MRNTNAMNAAQARLIAGALLLGALGSGCVDSAGEAPPAAQALGAADDPLDPAALDSGRLDPGWRQYVVLDSLTEVDSTGAPVSSARATSNPEKWSDIAAETVNRGPATLPLPAAGEGPSIAAVQVLLDRALFSTGVIDGKWGKNTEKAVYWLQRREQLRATGQVDSATAARLRTLAGAGPLVREHALTAEDVAGPFRTLPEDIYARAELECLCYESLTEKLAERFHTTPELLAQLNPNLDLNRVSAGDVVQAPVPRDTAAAAGGNVTEIMISDGGGYLHALDAEGRILFHFPSTLGSEYAPSPTGRFEVTRIARDPTWHYQPELLTGVPDRHDDAVLPPGPNNAVGLVWIELSQPHYGIHGTSAPETIGYATSNGCVRLTNWDALFLAGRVRTGTPVNFRDTTRAADES